MLAAGRLQCWNTQSFGMSMGETPPTRDAPHACRSQPPGATTSLRGTIPATPDSITGGRLWASPAGWVTTPQVVIKDCTLVVPLTEFTYW
jgi:hypothetical protein